MQVADAFVRFLADTKEMARSLGPGGPVDKAAQTGGATVGTRIGNAIGTGINRGMQAGGVAAGAFFATGLEAATALEDELRTVNTVAGLSDEALAKLGDDVQGLSRETGRSTSDLTAGLYDLVSAGVPASEAINVLRDSAKLAVGAMGTTGEAVDAVTSALNAYELGADKSGEVTDILAKAVADGKVTISEIGSTIAQIAPIASSAGVSLEEVSAGYATLTAKGVPAAQAATQMRAAISALLTPNEALLKLQEETGVAFADVAREKGLAVALEELRQATGGNEEAFAKSLGSIDAYQFALATTGEEADGFQEQIAETMDAAGIANEQYAEKSKSAAEQGKRALAGIMTFAQDVGGPFVDTIGPGLFALNEMGRAFGLPISPAKLLGGAIGGLATKAIPMLLMGLAGIIPAIGGAIAGIGTAIGGILTAALAAWPLLLLAAIVAGIIFLVNNPEIVAAIGDFIGNVLEWLGSFLAALPGLLVDAFVFAFGFVVDAIPAILGAIAQAIFALPGLLAELVPKLVGLWARAWAFIITTAVGFVRNVVGFILSIPGKVAPLVGQIGRHFIRVAVEAIGNAKRLVEQVVTFIMSIPGRIAALAGQVVSFFAGIFSRVLSGISSFVSSAVRFLFTLPGKLVALGGQIVSSIIRGLASLPGQLLQTVGNAFRNLRLDIGPFHISGSGITVDLPQIKLPSFAVGSSFIPADMLAMVHKGEIVVPADEARAIREGRATLGKPGAGGSASISGSSVGGGTTKHYTINVLRPDAPDPFDLVDKLALLERAYSG